MIDALRYPLLAGHTTPELLRTLPEDALPILAEELRAFLIETLNVSGGHFAGGLGAVELTIALHYLFDTPHDRLIWDVGHQAYPHKILTNRAHQLSTIRKQGGLAGFPRREESPYDTFGVGHSSTSISAAIGMALGNQQAGVDRKVVAIIGDGGMTAGMAFEALNHGGDSGANVLVILNDNEMSISENVGSLSNYFVRVLSSKFYTSMRSGSKKVLKKLPHVWEFARRTEEHLKGMVVPGTLFEELGFNYVGPVDGHDLPWLIQTLRNMQNLEGPQFLHVVTRKGKGYAPAEEDPIAYHAVSPGYIHKAPSVVTEKKPTYSEIFGQWLCAMAAHDSRLVAITPAMREGSGMVQFSKDFPAQYIDVGIAEQHSVTLAAGLACEGRKPVVAIYSTFLQRAYDQLIHDVALQNLPVLFAIDRAGLVGNDGPTHAGSFDLTYLRCIPNMIIMVPSDEQQCWQMLTTGFLHNGPAAVRYPRGIGTGISVHPTLDSLRVGKAEWRRKGEKIALLCFGPPLAEALLAAETLNASVVDMRFVKPLDETLLEEVSRTHTLLVTLEENAIAGGAGSAVSEWLAAHQRLVAVLHLGIPDRYIEHGTQAEQAKDCGLTASQIVEKVKVFAT